MRIRIDLFAAISMASALVLNALLIVSSSATGAAEAPPAAASLISPASDFDHLVTPSPGDSRRCLETKRANARQVTDRDAGNRRFVRRLNKRMAGQPGREIEVLISLPTVHTWVDVVPSNDSGVSITGVGLFPQLIPGSLFRSNAYPIPGATSADDVFDYAIQTLQRRLADFQRDVDQLQQQVDRSRERRPEIEPTRLLRRLAAAQDRLATATASVKRATRQQGRIVSQVTLRGTPGAIIDHLGPASVYSGDKYVDLTKNRKFVRLIMDQAQVSRKRAIEIIRENGWDHTAEVDLPPDEIGAFQTRCTH